MDHVSIFNVMESDCMSHFTQLTFPLSTTTTDCLVSFLLSRWLFLPARHLRPIATNLTMPFLETSILQRPPDLRSSSTFSLHVPPFPSAPSTLVSATVFYPVFRPSMSALVKLLQLPCPMFKVLSTEWQMIALLRATTFRRWTALMVLRNILKFFQTQSAGQICVRMTSFNLLNPVGSRLVRAFSFHSLCRRLTSSSQPVS